MNATLIPNPGSGDAVAQGCICPVFDNAHGEGAWTRGKHWAEGGLFWIAQGCPLHAPGGADES